MIEVDQLRLCSARGVVDDVNPAGCSPRQVCIALAEDLTKHEISPINSRANIVLDMGANMILAAGSILSYREIVMRITLPCEPCAHGAKLADASVARFRRIDRFLAVVVSGGILSNFSQMSLCSDTLINVPTDFRARTAWALDRIPNGMVVDSCEFLNAIGASHSYARTLPRWLETAQAQGKPAHRVLTAKLTAPSWAPNAFIQLQDEGLIPELLSNARYPLTHSLWFSSEMKVAN